MPRRRAPWWVYACAAPFLAYFALLVYCDLQRPESDGLSFVVERGFVFRHVEDDGLVVTKVEPGSPAARAGLEPGDRIAVVDGQRIGAHKVDWATVATNVEFDKPIVLDLNRQGSRLRLALRLGRSPWSRWLTREGLDLMVARLVQLVTLALGLLILFRRPDDAVARLGAWLLGSVGVFCVIFPFRIAAVWRGLWWPLGFALWLPFVSSLLLGALLLSFFLVFPARRVRSAPALAALWVPALAASAPFVRYQLAAVYSPGHVLGLWDGFDVFLVVSIAYLVATVASAAWSYRRLADETERRRLRVLLAGAVLGCSAAGTIVIGWWRTEGMSLFASTTMGWVLPLLLTVPVSFAYAILRHRLFDVRLIVRQGVRYALARRLLLSLVPALLLVMAVDLYLHRHQPMGEVLTTRATVYLLLSACAVFAQFWRQRWLVGLDRRFFRERYDAQRLLRQVADDIREAGNIERVAGRVVAQIELAVHPRFVALLLRPSGSDTFRPLATSPAGAGPERFPGGGKLLALARVLGRPVEISSRDTGWLGTQLPEEEVRAVREMGLELVVPIVTDPDGPEAFIALGARRSEEPYAREDQDLLGAIAATLGVLLAHDAGLGTLAVSFRECPRCGACYDETEQECRVDAAPLSAARLPRVLVARYRLDRRLARGGMGTVYSAADLALQRTVAVKVLREDLVGDRDAAERFEREARTAASFSHPHVVTIHDFGITRRGRGFLVMEWLQGRTLRAEMEEQGALPPRRVVHLLKGVCAAVDAAHRRQLVHRDLKPENIFLAAIEGTETAKVLDFGIAKAFRSAVSGSERQTAVGILVGTPEYMAPEQLRGEDVSPGWDLWSLAVIAYEMLTGQHPFSAVVVGRAAPVLPVGHTVVLNEALSRFDRRWSAFFASALSLEPAERPPSASAFSDDLERILLP